MWKTLATIALILLLPAGAGRAEDGDPVIAALRAEARGMSPLDHAVTRETTDNSGKTRQRLARFDPRRPAGERWTLLARNGGEPSPRYRDKAEAGLAGEIPQSYAMVARMLDGPVRFIDEANGVRRYRIAPLGAGSIMIDGRDISGNIKGIAHIDMTGERPLLIAMDLSVSEAFRPRWFAHIETGEGRISFGSDRGGRPVILSYSLRVRGSHPIGRIDYETAMRFFDHVYVGSDSPSPSADPLER